jgi:hypothetical protein
MPCHTARRTIAEQMPPSGPYRIPGRLSQAPEDPVTVSPEEPSVADDLALHFQQRRYLHPADGFAACTIEGTPLRLPRFIATCETGE